MGDTVIRQLVDKSPRDKVLRLLTLNIGGPSLLRAESQFAWLVCQEVDVIVLTETRAMSGTRRLAERFAESGWSTFLPIPENGDRGVLIVSRLSAAVGRWAGNVNYLSHRCASVVLQHGEREVEITGLYVPSRDATAMKVLKKKMFIESFCGGLPDDARIRLVVGDFNVVERGHIPRYSTFKKFEYEFLDWFAEVGLVDAYRSVDRHGIEHSWVGRTGNGYRYDHAFVSREFVDRIVKCQYDHAPRAERLSDHSALRVELR